MPDPQLVEDLLLRAMELEASRRGPFLERVCQGQPELLRDVESLLRVANRFPLDAILPSPPCVPKSVGRYLVVGQLGRGGMGCVYLGRDPVLERLVAIKILSAVGAGGYRPIGSLRREALALAQIDHPNVARVYSIEEGDGAPFLTMEYVPGPGLGERLRRGRLKRTEALRVAREVASALEATHRAGLIHRDIKPSNVGLTLNDQVKVLDFGLAKLQGPLSTGIESIQTGSMVGSPGFMSPEQLRGQPVDHRSDLWSFGCLLFECLSGVPAFAGHAPADRIAATLGSEPPWDRLPRWVPPELRQTLQRCLSRTVSERPTSFAQVLPVLREAAVDHQQPADRNETATYSVQTKRARLGWPTRPVQMGRCARVMRARVSRATLGACILGAATLALLRLDRPGFATIRKPEATELGQEAVQPAVAPSNSRIQLPRERQVTFSGDVNSADLSPDGRRIACVRNSHHLWIQDCDTGAERHLMSANLYAPRWSPDGRSILVAGFPSEGAKDCVSWIVDVSSGSSTEVGPPSFRGMSWAPDGIRVAGVIRDDGILGTRICIVEVATGDTTLLSLPLEEDASVCASPSNEPSIVPIEDDGSGFDRQHVRSIHWSPAGHLLSVTIKRGSDLRSYVATLDGSRTFELDATPVGWSPRGEHLITVVGDGIAATAIDPLSGQPLSGEETVIGRIRGRNLSMSRDGSRILTVDRLPLTYVMSAELNSSARSPVHGDADLSIPDWTRIANGAWPSISPDGEQVVFTLEDGAGGQICVADFEGGPLKRLTARPGSKTYPVWSPDGGRIAYIAEGEGIRILDLGSGAERLVSDTCFARNLYWAPFPNLVYQDDRTGTRGFKRYDPESGEAGWFPLAPENGTAFQLAPSPECTWVAVSGNRGHRSGVRTWLVSTSTAEERLLHDEWAGPLSWSRDGEWVYLVNDIVERSGTGYRVFRVNVHTSQVEEVARLPGSGTGWRSLTICPDGRRIVRCLLPHQGDAWLLEGVGLQSPSGRMRTAT